MASTAGFSETAMTKKLAALTTTMASIQTLSLWLMHHRKHSNTIAALWHKEVLGERSCSRLLSLVYVANDVIQNSRRKWPQFAQHFYPFLPAALVHVVRHADNNAHNALIRVLHVWKDRAVFSHAAINKLLSAANAAVTTSNDDIAAVSTPDDSIVATTSTAAATLSPFMPSQRPSLKRKSEDSSSTPLFSSGPSTADLLRALRTLEEPASADGDTRQQIASFPESVANPAFLRQIANGEQAELLHKKIREAEPVVDDYCKRVSEEMEQRRETQQMIIDYLRVQKEKAMNTQDLLDRFREKRDKLKTDRIEVYKHYESLPDLSKLPNIEQLNPLPSAGELFDKK